MIKDIFNELETDIKSGIEGLAAVRQYNGEFEDDAEWNPIFPIVLWELVSYLPKVKDGEGKILTQELEVNFYCGNKRDATDLLENLINYLDGFYIEVPDIGLYRVEIQECKLMGWQKNVQIYVVNAKII